jgi:hypothetical protein
MFRKGTGSWTQYRGLNIPEVDFHRCDRNPAEGPRPWEPYDARMARVYHDTLAALKDAYERGVPWVLVTHGASTSRPGKMTSRSMVRSLMRSKAATPYIRRRECIQHDTVFVAAIKPKPKA